MEVEGISKSPSKIHGWFVNEARKRRATYPNTLSDSQVAELIQKIDVAEQYTKLDPRLDWVIRMRDKALIATAWILFKRANEILNLRLRDVHIDDRYLYMTFKIEKKLKNIKRCPACGEKNSTRALFCSHCSRDLASVTPQKEGIALSTIVTKRKVLTYPFCKHIAEWIKFLVEQNSPSDTFLFPAYSVKKGGRIARSQHISFVRFDQILQRLDHSMSSHMFRYGKTEQMFKLGYSAEEIMEVADWATPGMPLIYAKRKGLTISQQKYSEDLRTT